MIDFKHNIEFALYLDQQDPLREFRNQFFIPQFNGQDKIYFCGNSLGLQPKTVSLFVQTELLHWQMNGVDGHFLGSKPWLTYHKNVTKQLAMLTGGLPEEVVAMGSLTNNLHLLMVSFYQPRGKKVKILVEKGAFSSDMYVVESQLIFHNLIPTEALIEVSPREGEYCLRTEDIIRSIEENKEEIALVLLGGVNYYTGEVIEMHTVTSIAHQHDIKIGFDLAHAIGNIPMELHQWQVDFAVWCSYKYLNSGPGAVAGIFVHQKHHNDPTLKRFAGWWGHDEKSRFKMQKGFKPLLGAESWQLSNAPVVPLAIHQAALEIFEAAGLDHLVNKSRLLFNYLVFIIQGINTDKLEIITPLEAPRHGCQLSLFVKSGNKELFNYLENNGVVLDWREPNVIRIAPVPLYNSFNEVYQFGQLLKRGLDGTK